METHVKVLGVLHIVLAAFGLLAALVIVLATGTIAGIIGTSGDPDARTAIPILGLAGGALATFLVLLSVPGLVAGWGLLNLRPWARVLTVVLSVLLLVHVPFGTVVGIYGLWVLLSKQTEPLFAANRPAV
jgi:hypothetical protein